MTAATDAIRALSSAVDASQPVDKAGSVVVAMLLAQARATASLIDTEIVSVSASIDNYDDAGAMPDAAAAMVSGLSANVDTQLVLADARGLVGRAASNLAQVIE